MEESRVVAQAAYLFMQYSLMQGPADETKVHYMHQSRLAIKPSQTYLRFNVQSTVLACQRVRYDSISLYELLCLNPS